MKKAFVILAAAVALQGTAVAGDVTAGKAKFNQLCATCHGMTGQGDGPAAAAMNPKPRSFADAEWQASTSDERIAEVTKKGGAGTGLSPAMPPLGASLSDADMANLIAFIRSLQ
jgi:cytochrome c553